MNKYNKSSNSFINFINKLLICTIIFLSLAIISKSNINYKEKIYNYLYKTNINFSYFKNLYNKYLGGVSILKENNKTAAVFKEKINYKNITSYEEGVKLEVNEKYLVPNLEKGIVVFIGNKDKYNNTIVIENEDGIDTWYGNICNTTLKLYDNIETSQYIGESCNNYIYLIFKKGETTLDYNKYIA